MLIDAHAHLHEYDTGRELRGILNEIEREKILTIGVSMDGPTYERTKKMAREHPLVIAAFGVHPWEAPKHQRHLESFDAQIAEAAMIGEIGLDYRFVKDEELWPSQRKVFEYFLRAAREQGKIVNVHTSGAEAEVAAMLEEHGIERAIIHWYAGPEETFHRMAARGCYFTFGVELTTSEHIRMLARECPAGQLLTETDNPGGAKWLFGQRGTPRMIGKVVRELAQARETSAAEIIAQVQQNFLRLIRDDERLAPIRARLEPKAPRQN